MKVSEQRAHEIIETLSKRFKVEPPKLVMGDDTANGPEGKGGFMDSLSRAIHLGDEADESALIHEYAHILDLDARGILGPRQEEYGPHGRGFYKQLVRVLRAHYGDPSKYPSWHTDEDEYKHLRRWAHEDGYTEVEPPEVDPLEDLLTAVGLIG